MALSLCKDGELGELVSTDEAKPWERPKRIVLTQADFPETVEIVLANGIYIGRDGVSQAALNKIKRLAAFKNPDFYKSQAMRLPTYNKPRIIDTSWETDNYLYIPRGCENELLKLLSDVGVPYQTEDNINVGKMIGVEFRDRYVTSRYLPLLPCWNRTTVCFRLQQLSGKR